MSRLKTKTLAMVEKNRYRKYYLLISKMLTIGLIVGGLVGTAPAQDRSDEKEHVASVGSMQSLLSSPVTYEMNDSSVLNKIISLHLNEVTLLEALRSIAIKADLKLSYRTQRPVLDKKLTLNLEQTTIEKALWRVLEDTGLRFAVSPKGQLVLLKKKPEVQLQSVQETIRGTVTDSESGDVLPGVNILVKGTTTGTSTDAEGSFELTVSFLQDTLVISSVGYQTQEVPINGRTEIDVMLQSQTVAGEELVVVGYGTQEKVNLTGAVDQVTSNDLQNRHMQNLIQGLQGMMPNVNINIDEGKPIHARSINIRGTTSIGAGGAALVLIDGVEGDPSMLDPNDIESISVLKDASAAAVYGARGAFGVVHITTKKPTRDELTISYSGSIGMNQPTVPQNQYVTDGLTWANMFLESFVNWGGTFPQNANKTLPFSQDYLDEIERRSADPSLDKTWVAQDGTYRYAHSTDWYRKLFHSRAFTANHDLSVSGSSGNVNFMVTGRLRSQDGLIRLSPDDYQMMNLRAKGTVDFTDWLQVNSNFDFSKRTYFNPMNCCDAQFAQLDIALEGFPLAPLYNPDGTLTHSGAYALGGYAEGHNGVDLERTIIRNTTGFEARFFEDRLRAVGDFSFQRRLDEREQKRVPVPFSRAPGAIEVIGGSNNWLRIDNDKRNFVATNFHFEYHDTFQSRHDVQATVGINYEESTTRELATRRGGLIFPGAQDINLALGEDIDTAGGYTKWAILGGFYRLNYIFDERYLLELSGRYDGSSRFPENERYAFFPSASAGWRISSEPFWNVSDEFVSHLQLRASYGSMGNGNVEAYKFHETFNINRSGRILDGTRPRFTSNPDVLPIGLTWETVTTRNLGIDLEMASGKLSFTGDMYIREATDMFTQALTPPAIFGASPPEGNYADLETRGWEAELSWRDQFQMAGKPFQYNIRLNMADYQAEITRYNNPDKFLDDHYESKIMGEIWGYETDGFFVDQTDIDNHADQSRFRSTASGQYHPGDLKLRDLNGDGVINPGENTADNPGDRKVIGNTTPRYTFGVNLGADWNNMFISLFFQGVGKQDWYPSDEANFWGQYNRPYNQIPEWHLDDGIIWSEENSNSFFPRYVSRIASSSDGILQQPQTRYLMNAAYVRLKNLQVGYHLPQRFISQLGMRSATIYFSGENLWAWSPLYKTADNLDIENMISRSDEIARPGETIRQGYNYPIMRSLTLGVSIDF